jgi:ketosteroid isomerase-like protein
MSDQLIEALYAGLDAHDGEAMAACYAPDAVFEDPAFGELRDGHVKDMWRMLCAGTTDLRVELREHGAQDGSGDAHWIATYTFRTGKHVVNDVQARFRFGDDGLIADHRDAFDLRKWASQAIGSAGTVLGYTPLLKPFIQRTTGKQLAKWRAEHA